MLTSTSFILRPAEGRSEAGGFEAGFDGAVGLEVHDAEIDAGFGGHIERLLRNEADQLSTADSNAMFGGELFDPGEHVVGRGGFVVGQVDGHLGNAFGGQCEAEGADAGEAAIGFANRPGDGFGEFEVVGLEFDVPGDENLAGADGDGAGGGVEFGLAEVGKAVDIGVDRHFEFFKADLADVGEGAALREDGGFAVEIDGNPEAVPDLGADGVGDPAALDDSDAAKGNEGNHIGGADAGMHAVLIVQVDQLRGDADRAHGGFADLFGSAGECDDAAVVIGVAIDIQDSDAFDVAKGLGDGRDDFGAAAFGIVGRAFDEGSVAAHDTKVPAWTIFDTRFTPIKWTMSR